MKLNELKNKSKTLSLDTQYGRVNIVYCPAKFTAEVEGMVADGQEKPVTAIVQLLGRLVMQWDIEGDDGKPLAVSEETLLQMPVDLLVVMVKGITEDMRPNVVNAPA